MPCPPPSHVICGGGVHSDPATDPFGWQPDSGTKALLAESLTKQL